jgi:hypothetical protein
MPSSPARWLSPEELIDVALERSRLILVNEAHNGLRRCVRTREVGVRLIKRAHAAGVRHLAMEALQPIDADVANATRRPPDRPRYLGQPEMGQLIATALELGWELIAYEADMTRKPPAFGSLSQEETNWRENQQATNLSETISRLSAPTRLIVWCGNHHLAKTATAAWRPMGSLLGPKSGIEPFSIDQTLSVRLADGRPRTADVWVAAFAPTLDGMGGTAGFLAEEAPDGWPEPDIADAYLLSTQNEMT